MDKNRIDCPYHLKGWNDRGDNVMVLDGFAYGNVSNRRRLVVNTRMLKGKKHKAIHMLRGRFGTLGGGCLDE